MSIQASFLRRGAAVAAHLSAAAPGTFFILLSAAGFGAMSIFAKVAYASGANVPTTLFLRFVLASVVLWGGLALTGRIPRALSGRFVIACAGLGAIVYATMSLALFSALVYVSASLVALVLYTYPTIVTVLAFLLLREGLGRRKCLALAISSLGLVLVLGMSVGSAHGPGVVLALLASVAYSAYIVAARVLLRGAPALVASAIVIPAAGATFGVYAAVSGTLRLSMSLSAYAAIVGMALLSTVLAIVAFLVGLERVGASRAAILSTFEPVVTLTLAATLLGERLAPMQLAGGACILGAVLLLHAQRRPQARNAALPTGASERSRS
ncbi:MAG TPA: DMT family transporter [bacterium]|nr:DMT family transporter [bacterium]